MDLPLIPEPDLVLGGMNVHIHLGGREPDTQDHHRVAPPFQEGPVRLEHGVLHHPIPDEAPVDVGIDEPGSGAGCLWPPHQTGHRALSLLILHRIEPSGKSPPQKGCHPLFETTRSHRKADLAVSDEGETDLRSRQRQAVEELPHVPPLGLAAPEKLEPRRGIEKEVAHRNHRPPGHAAGLHLTDAPPLGIDLGPFQALLHPAGQSTAGDRGDGGERPPRNPREVRVKRSLSEAILLVACRSRERSASSRDMP